MPLPISSIDFSHSCPMQPLCIQEDSNAEIYFVFLRFFYAYAMPVEAKNGHEILWNCSYRQLLATMLVMSHPSSTYPVLYIVCLRSNMGEYKMAVCSETRMFSQADYTHAHTRMHHAQTFTHTKCFYSFFVNFIYVHSVFE